jgi:hypothetical protein
MRLLILCGVIFILIDLSLETRADESLVRSDTTNNLHIETHIKQRVAATLTTTY